MLSAQLQPHFLFNTLHAISALVWEDQARADRLLARLSELLRLTLRSGTRVETTLEEELALLEPLRRDPGDPLRRPAPGLVSRSSRAARQAMVPHLILQPLVENAIRHGVTRRTAPGRVDVVRPWQGAGRLHLTVRDDGVGLPRTARCARASASAITRARLRQLYGREQRFDARAGGRRRRGVRAHHPAPARRERPRDRARIRALIVDDEPLARARLRGLLATHADMQLVGECADGGEPRSRGDRRGRVPRWCSSTSR